MRLPPQGFAPNVVVFCETKHHNMGKDTTKHLVGQL